MLARADEQFGGDPAPAAPAAVAITVDQLPGLCMGFSMLTSLALHKTGWGPLTNQEGEQLTAAVLKNVMAWDLLSEENVSNPKVRAGLDLGGVVIAIVSARLIAGRPKPPAPAPENETAAAA